MNQMIFIYQIVLLINNSVIIIIIIIISILNELTSL